jgi:hypothetical protein
MLLGVVVVELRGLDIVLLLHVAVAVLLVRAVWQCMAVVRRRVVALRLRTAAVLRRLRVGVVRLLQVVLLKRRVLRR